MRTPGVHVVGRCRSCGCIDSHPCVGGCFWVNEAHTVCSRCLKAGLIRPLVTMPQTQWLKHIYEKIESAEKFTGEPILDAADLSLVNMALSRFALVMELSQYPEFRHVGDKQGVN